MDKYSVNEMKAISDLTRDKVVLLIEEDGSIVIALPDIPYEMTEEQIRQSEIALCVLDSPSLFLRTIFSLEILFNRIMYLVTTTLFRKDD